MIAAAVAIGAAVAKGLVGLFLVAVLVAAIVERRRRALARQQEQDRTRREAFEARIICVGGLRGLAEGIEPDGSRSVWYAGPDTPAVEAPGELPHDTCEEIWKGIERALDGNAQPARVGRGE